MEASEFEKYTIADQQKHAYNFIAVQEIDK